MTLASEITRLAGIAREVFISTDVRLYYLLAIANDDIEITDDKVNESTQIGFRAIRGLVEAANIEDHYGVTRLIILEIIALHSYVGPNARGAERQEMADDEGSSEILITPEKQRDIRKRIRNE